MDNDTLHVLFLWHMHQPAYSIDHEPFLLPWTRLHATKDYLGMATLLESIPDFKCTFNFTPVLLEQIERYTDGAKDYEWLLSEKNSSDLTQDEILYVLDRFFTGCKQTIIDPYPRYLDLYRKLGPESMLDIPEKLKRTGDQDITDLVVWRMLAWMTPSRQQSDPFLAGLIDKGRGFSTDEKHKLLDYTRHIFSEIRSIYSKLADRRQIDISTTPYYHPILPLLLDSDAVKEALPHVQLPIRFSFPDDARWHVQAALEKTSEFFGFIPKGMWPAEGSVSEAAASLIREFNVEWIATDEDILAKSAGIQFIRDARGQINMPDVLYRPWSVETPNGHLPIFFRDHLLSDLLGFTYQSWDPEKASDDFISRLIAIHNRMKSKPFKSCVTIILDGENAWEYYRDGGFPFLKCLFEKLAKHPNLTLDTFSNFLKILPSEPVSLPRLFAGSWINGNFGIWIGHPEENKAWTLLDQTYRFLNFKKDDIPLSTYNLCKYYIRKAQGSDWFWWYGDDHYSEDKPRFDQLFRSLLLRVFEELKENPPDELKKSLLTEKPRVFKLVHPRMLLSPNIDGKLGSYFDWFGAGTIQYRTGFSTMHASSDNIFDSFKFGFDLSNLYLRLDPGNGFETSLREGITVILKFDEPSYEICLDLFENDNGDVRLNCRIDNDHFSSADISLLKYAFDDVLEIGVPFILLKAKRNDRIVFHIELLVGGRLSGRIPDLYEVEFNVPTEDYDNLMWEV